MNYQLDFGIGQIGLKTCRKLANHGLNRLNSFVTVILSGNCVKFQNILNRAWPLCLAFSYRYFVLFLLGTVQSSNRVRTQRHDWHINVTGSKCQNLRQFCTLHTFVAHCFQGFISEDETANE